MADTTIPPTLKIIQIGKHCLPNSLMIEELAFAPKLDISLLRRFFEVYKMTPKTIEAINKISLCIEPDVLWSNIMEIIKGGLNNQESKLLYIFFSLQSFRFPQTSVDEDSTKDLIHKSNMTIAKIKTELDNRIETPSEADKIIKIFLDNLGSDEFTWEEYLYNNLAIKYLCLMQPLPLGMLNNINHDFTINSIAPSLAAKERIKIIHESEVKKIEALVNKPENENRKMEFTYQIKEINEKIIKLEAELTFPSPELNAYHSRETESIRRLCVLSTDFYYLDNFDLRLSLLLQQKCPEYFAALTEQQRESINKKNVKKNVKKNKDENRIFFCQCQFCYRFRLDEIPPNGDYPWHCKRDIRPECGTRYDKWRKQLNRNGIYLLTVYQLDQ